MAGKTGAGKKTPGKRKTAGSRTPRKRAAGTSSPKRAVRTAKAVSAASKDRSPVYILAIMGLLCAVVILLNKFYTGGGKPGFKNIKAAEERTVDNKGSNEDAGTITAVKTEKTEKTERTEKPNVSAPSNEPSSDVKIYLIKYDTKTEIMSLVPITRRVSSPTPVREALNELIKGPTVNEEKRGLLTAIPENLKIMDVRIKKNTAVINFNGAIEENANGDILLKRIDQIVYTATQFKNVNSVLIRINGKNKDFLGSDGLSISGPISRRK